MRCNHREDTLMFLKHVGGPDKVMVEIGSYAGEFAEMASPFFKTIHCIDPWGREAMEDSGPKKIRKTGAQIEAAWDERAALYDNMVKHKGYDHQYVGEFADGSIDVLYIDSLHTFNACGLTALRWWTKIRKPGGYLAGHDYRHPQVMAVTPVINIFASMIRRPIFTTGDYSWAIELPGENDD